MATIFNYSPESVNMVVAGLFTVEGFVDGTFINVSKDVVPYAAIRTPDGTVARLYNNDQTYTITLTLHNGSEFNNILTKLWQVDEITQMGKFPVLIKDGSGSDLFFSATTWIEQLPVMAKSNSVDSRVWVMRSSQAIINFGGNEDVSSILNDLFNLATSAVPILQGIS